MKKLILVISVVLLFQSCFSYKAVENNSSHYEVGKSYRINEGKKTDMIRINTKTDSTLVVWSNFETKTIAIDQISKVEKRKFSIVKTVLLPISVAASLVLLFVLAY